MSLPQTQEVQAERCSRVSSFLHHDMSHPQRLHMLPLSLSIAAVTGWLSVIVRGC